MQFRVSARKLFTDIASVLLVAAAVGYLIGYMWPAIAIAAVFMLFKQIKHLHEMATWLWKKKTLSPPEASGYWGRVYDGLYRLIRRHRKKQRSLNEKVRRFRDAAEALPDAALVLSNDLTIQWGNKKAESLIGIKWPGDAGQRIDNLIRFPEFSQYIEDGEFEQPCNVPSPLDIEVQLELRMMAYGSDQILFLARDISKIHRLEEMRRDFVANVSHELKTPLTVVRGYVEMAQSTESTFTPRWQQAFTTIEGQVSRMDRLVEQLLILSRVEINAQLDLRYSVDMPDLIDHLLHDSQWLNLEKKHQINLDIDPSLGLMGNDAELKSACSNLISNAIAYTPENGEITISWQLENGSPVFKVTDNGVGIRAADVNRLTERFYRVDKSRSRDTGGSGLGLAIVKHVVSHHDGKLSIRSEIGKGSTFAITFSADDITQLKKKPKH